MYGWQRIQRLDGSYALARYVRHLRRTATHDVELYRLKEDGAEIECITMNPREEVIGELANRDIRRWL